MAALVLLQFLAGRGSWLNAGAGGTTNGMIEAAYGHIRPSGTFSFTTGLTGFTAMTAVFFLYHLLEQRVYPRLDLAGRGTRAGPAGHPLRQPDGGGSGVPHHERAGLHRGRASSLPAGNVQIGRAGGFPGVAGGDVRRVQAGRGGVRLPLRQRLEHPRRVRRTVPGHVEHPLPDRGPRPGVRLRAGHGHERGGRPALGTLGFPAHRGRTGARHHGERAAGRRTLPRPARVRRRRFFAAGPCAACSGMSTRCRC